MNKPTNPVIYWFRQDLRLADLPGLAAAAATGRPVIPCYIFDDASAGKWAPGGASRWWLHHSLTRLAEDIAGLGGELLVCAGDSKAVLQTLARANEVAGLFCSRAYEPWSATLESELHADLSDCEYALKRYPGTLLLEPEQIANKSGDPFKVFTPFWKACQREQEPHPPVAPPQKGVFASPDAVRLDERRRYGVDSLDLLPSAPNWAAGWEKLWQPGENGASQRLQGFLDDGLASYSDGRDHPGLQVTSRLSPHLHHGEISPRQVWHAAHAAMDRGASSKQVYKFLSELGWREFSYHLLHHFPHIPDEPFKPAFAGFPWLGDKEHLRAWQRGKTGYPIVDAGMRELWQTGFMHNRVRMVVASFLTKHLLIPWQAGEAWFWDCLLDADLASNACSWQWVAGSGADAAPYFRIFNPTTQGEKFDKQGDYVRRWVPELAGVPDKYLHQPSAAPADVLKAAGVELGKDYPAPIVDHKQAREAALAAYQEIRAG